MRRMAPDDVDASALHGDRRVRAWVTGASGFIGRRVMQVLLARGVEAMPLSRRVFVDTSLLQVQTVPDFLIDLGWGDLDDYAHPSHVQAQQPQHVALHRAAAAAGVRTIVGIGTAAEYGVVHGPLVETMPAAPVSGYAIAKHGVGTALQRLAITTGIRWRWLRLFGLWGEGQPTRTLYGQVARLREDAAHRLTIPTPERRVDVLAVDEMASRIVSLALQSQCDGVINCGAGVGVPIRALVAEWLHDAPALLSRVTWGPGRAESEPDGYWADTHLMHQALEAAHVVSGVAVPVTRETSS